MSNTILIVEDELDFAALLRHILTQEGFTVATAFNWADATRELNAKTPDLITLDINMPTKSGVFFYRDIKADRRFRDIPVVVVTGLTRDEDDMKDVLRSLMDSDIAPPPDAYVEKPVDRACFLRAVRETLATRKSARY